MAPWPVAKFILSATAFSGHNKLGEDFRKKKKKTRKKEEEKEEEKVEEKEEEKERKKRRNRRAQNGAVRLPGKGFVCFRVVFGFLLSP